MIEQQTVQTTEPTARDLQPILALYESGRYLSAYEQAVARFGSLSEWQGTPGRILAGRMAVNLGAPWLGQRLHLLAYRHDPHNPAARYAALRLRMERKGPLAVLQRMEAWGDPAPSELSPLLAAPPAEWYAYRALAFAMLRDFDTAEAWFARAEQADPGNPWVWVERSSALEQEDRYEEAEAAARRSLELRPWYRAGLQALAHLLELQEKDEEALALLTEACARLESGVVAFHLATLQNELGLYADAETTLDRCLQLMPLASLRNPADSGETAPTLQPGLQEDEDDDTEPLASFRSDVAYHQGDLLRSLALARKVRGYFYTQLTERMEKAVAEGVVHLKPHRVQLPVPFVRQHHVTCAPATLTAISRFWQKPADHLAVVEAICYDGTPAHSERKWAEDNGWLTREFTLTWESAVALLDRGVPFTLATMGTGMGHLQAVIGYDSIRGVLLLRDPYYRHIGEALMPELLKSQRSSGPRAMAMVPSDRAELLEGIELPEAELYDFEYRLQTYLVNHQRQEAQAAYDTLCSVAPEHRLTLYARRALAAYDADRTELLASADALLAHFPEDVNLQLFRLGLLRELSRREEHLLSLETLAAPTEKPSADAPTNPARFDPIYWMQYAGELAEDAREHNRALKLIRKTLQLQPTHGDALELKARIFWQQRRFSEALELYRVASCLGDKDERLAYSYFQAARYLKKTEQALELLRARFRRSGSRSSLPARTLFYALFDLDRTTEALDLLEKAIGRRPQDGELLTFAASRYAQLGRFDRAEALMAAAEGKLSKADTLRAQAELAAEKGGNAEALSLWRAVLELDPLALDAHRAVAAILESVEGPEAVMTHFEGYSHRFPHHFGLHQLWADAARAPEMAAIREEVLSRLVEINPADGWTRRERAYFLVERNRLKEAMEEAAIAYQLEPTSSAVFAVRGQIFLGASRFAEARTAFSEAIRLSAENDHAMAQLVRLCDTAQQRREALDFIRGELTRQTIYGDGLLAYRRYAQNVFTPEELLSQLYDALQARPDLWHAWSATIEQLIETHRLDEALKFARIAVERFPLLPPLYLDLASVHEAREEAEEEQAVLQQALTIRRNWSPALRALCIAYDRAHQPEKAVELLTAALEREPLNAENNLVLASTFWRMGERGQALERLKTAVRLEPRYSHAWGQLEEWSRVLEREEEVTLEARAYCRRSPREPHAHLTLARVLPDTDQTRPERLAHLDEAIRLSPRLWEAYQLKAEILAAARRWDEAFSACRPVGGGRVPPSLLLAAARIEARRTGVRAAIQRLRGSVAGEPQFYEGWHQLAEWNRDQGQDTVRGYLEAAQKMTELRPQEVAAWGYLSDARARNQDRAGAKAALAHAFNVDRSYGYAGFTLINLQLEDGETDAAAQTLNRLAGAVTDAWVPAFGVRIAGKQRNMAAAQQWLVQLITLPSHHADSVESPLNAALNVFRELGWTEEASHILVEQLRENPAVRPEAAGSWVRLCLEPGENPADRRNAPAQWSLVQATLPYLRAKGEAGVEAMAAYIEVLGDQERRQDLTRAVRDHWDFLRAHPATWAAVGQALLAVGEERLASDWMADWELRADLLPWMYLVPAASLRNQGRDAEAIRASHRALSHRQQDNSEPRHAVWLAVETALAGNLDAAVPFVERAGDSDELPPYFQFLYGLALAVIRVQQTPPLGRRTILNQVKDILAQTRARFPQARENAVLSRYYSRVVRRIAEDIGGPAASMWAMTSSRL